MTSGSRAGRSPAVEMVEKEDWGSVRIAQLEQQDLLRYQRDRAKMLDLVRIRRPVQRFGMGVPDYYQRFCDWKEEMIAVGYPDDDSSYIDYFIGDLQRHIRLRVLERRSSLNRLIDAYYAAHHHEVMIRLDEFIKNFRAPNEIEEMACQTTIEIQGDDNHNSVEEEAEPYAKNLRENIAEQSAHNPFDEMSKPNPSELELENECCDAAVKGNGELNEIQVVFAEMPKLNTKIQQSFYMESLAPSKPDKQLGDEEVQHSLMKMDCLKLVHHLLAETTPTLPADPYIRGTNFNNITLFDPGGDRTYAMKTSGGFVFELFCKAHGTCDNGVEAVDGRKNVMKSEACSDFCIWFDEFTEVSPTAIFNEQLYEHYAPYFFDECPQPFLDEQSDINGGGVDMGGIVLPFMDLQSVLNPINETTINGSCKGSTKARIGKSTSIMESVWGKNVMKDHAYKVSDRMTNLIATARPTVSLFMNERNADFLRKMDGNQLFEMMEQSFWLWIKSTEAYHLMLDDIVWFSDRNNNGTQVLVFDPGTGATENIFPNGSSIVEMKGTFNPLSVPSFISLKNIGATVLSNMHLPSLQPISFISWSGNGSIDESSMKHLLDQEEREGYSWGHVLHGCEVGQPHFLIVRSVKADYELFDKVVERIPVEQRNGSGGHGYLVPPDSFSRDSGFKDDASKAVLGISSSKMMFGGMKFNEMTVFMFDPGIRSWHRMGSACINSVDTNGLKYGEMLNYGELLHRVYVLLNWQLMIAVCFNKVSENRVDSVFAFLNVLPISISPTAEQPCVAHYIWCLLLNFIHPMMLYKVVMEFPTFWEDVPFALVDGLRLTMSHIVVSQSYCWSILWS